MTFFCISNKIFFSFFLKHNSLGRRCQIESIITVVRFKSSELRKQTNHRQILSKKILWASPPQGSASARAVVCVCVCVCVCVSVCVRALTVPFLLCPPDFRTPHRSQGGGVCVLTVPFLLCPS